MSNLTTSSLTCSSEKALLVMVWYVCMWWQLLLEQGFFVERHFWLETFYEQNHISGTTVGNTIDEILCGIFRAGKLLKVHTFCGVILICMNIYVIFVRTYILRGYIDMHEYLCYLCQDIHFEGLYWYAWIFMLSLSGHTFWGVILICMNIYVIFVRTYILRGYIDMHEHLCYLCQDSSGCTRPLCENTFVVRHFLVVLWSCVMLFSAKHPLIGDMFLVRYA